MFSKPSSLFSGTCDASLTPPLSVMFSPWSHYTSHRQLCTASPPSLAPLQAPFSRTRRALELEDANLVYATPTLDGLGLDVALGAQSLERFLSVPLFPSVRVSDDRRARLGLAGRRANSEQEIDQRGVLGRRQPAVGEMRSRLRLIGTQPLSFDSSKRAMAFTRFLVP